MRASLRSFAILTVLAAPHAARANCIGAPQEPSLPLALESVTVDGASASIDAWRGLASSVQGDAQFARLTGDRGTENFVRAR